MRLFPHSTWLVFVGIDPAGPLYYEKAVDDKLDAGDGDIVIAIHSNGGDILHGEAGYLDPVGHIDFYPNGGRHQPGCTDLGILTELLTRKYLIQYKNFMIFLDLLFLQNEFDKFRKLIKVVIVKYFSTVALRSFV